MAKTESVTAQAWNASKSAADPDFDAIPELGFKENLEFRAAKVKETGVAVTPFELEVEKILAKTPTVEAPVEATKTPVAPPTKAKPKK